MRTKKEKEELNPYSCLPSGSDLVHWVMFAYMVPHAVLRIPKRALRWRKQGRGVLRVDPLWKNGPRDNLFPLFHEPMVQSLCFSISLRSGHFAGSFLSHFSWERSDVALCAHIPHLSTLLPLMVLACRKKSLVRVLSKGIDVAVTRIDIGVTQHCAGHLLVILPSLVVLLPQETRRTATKQQTPLAQDVRKRMANGVELTQSGHRDSGKRVRDDNKGSSRGAQGTMIWVGCLFIAPNTCFHFVARLHEPLCVHFLCVHVSVLSAASRYAGHQEVFVVETWIVFIGSPAFVKWACRVSISTWGASIHMPLVAGVPLVLGLVRS